MMTIDRYYEPCFGSGAMAIALWNSGYRFKSWELSDANPSLMYMYKWLRIDPEGVISAFQSLQDAKLACATKDEQKKFYIRARNTEAPLPVLQAARILFLFRNGFNGLWRVNKKGKNNVPWGDKSGAIALDTLRQFSCMLCAMPGGLSIANVCGIVLNDVQYGDFIYIDPPYTKGQNFTGYTAHGWNYEDDCLLKYAVDYAVSQGAQVMLSMAATEENAKLWKGYEIHFIDADDMIAAITSKRGKRKEFIVTTYHARMKPQEIARVAAHKQEVV